MNRQEFFNNVCSSLRDYGNPYGGFLQRTWGWVDPKNPNNRCAIARFISGSCDREVINNLTKALKNKNIEPYADKSLVGDIVMLFDYYPEKINNKISLEIELKSLADKHNLTYKEATSQVAVQLEVAKKIMIEDKAVLKELA